MHEEKKQNCRNRREKYKFAMVSFVVYTLKFRYKSASHIFNVKSIRYNSSYVAGHEVRRIAGHHNTDKEITYAGMDRADDK